MDADRIARLVFGYWETAFSFTRLGATCQSLTIQSEITAESLSPEDEPAHGRARHVLHHVVRVIRDPNDI